MARRRYISTVISVDRDVDRLAQEAGDFAALLYTWMIPHAEDDCSLTGDPDELLITVVPRRRDKTPEDVAKALDAMDRLGLITWDREGKRVYFPPETFYRYQTYIPEQKRRSADSMPQRRTTATNAEEQRETAENTVILALPSPIEIQRDNPSQSILEAEDPAETLFPPEPPDHPDCFTQDAFWREFGPKYERDIGVAGSIYPIRESLLKFCQRAKFAHVCARDPTVRCMAALASALVSTKRKVEADKKKNVATHHVKYFISAFEGQVNTRWPDWKEEAR